MERSNLDRINQLARIAKERPLTQEELQERDRLRKAYLQAFRSSFRDQLDHTVIRYEDGTETPLTRKKG